MAMYAAGLNAAVDGIASAGTRIAFFSDDPTSAGNNEISGTGRPATTWGAASNGTRVGTQVGAPIGAGITVKFWGVMTAASGGTLLAAYALPANEAFGSAGTMQFTPTLTVAN